VYCPKKGNILRKFILPRKGNFAAWRITFTHTTMTSFLYKVIHWHQLNFNLFWILHFCST
jgi:hypothetical protein